MECLNVFLKICNTAKIEYSRFVTKAKFFQLIIFFSAPISLRVIQVNLFSEPLILASTNLQYDKRLFIDLPVLT